LYKYLTQHDLSNIESVHLRATFISTCISYIVNNTPRLHTLDLRFLCSTMYQRADPINFEELDAFPPLVTHPRVLHFCSQTEGAGSGFAPDECTSRMRGTRFPFATLLHQLDVGQIEHLEVGAEALSLPFAVTYTWSSLRELIITRIRMHNDPQTPLDDPRLKTPASAHEAVHLGTLVCAAPQLRVLRVRCHRSDLYPHVQWTVWPPDDPPLPSRSSMPAIEEFELYNPFATDGVYKYLPSTLRTLSLLNYPHVQCATLATEGWEIQPPPYPMDGVLRPAGLMHALTAVSAPELRTLHISFRDVDDTRLWTRIADLFPLLEVLELHDEIGPGSIWGATKLASCARALSSLSHLRSLRLNTFRRVLDAEDWKGYPGEREVYETPDQKARAGILMEDVKSALFGDDVGSQSKHVDTGPPTDLTSRWPELRDVWLPTSVYQFPYRSRVPRLFRHWKVYDVYRDDCGQRYMRPRSRHAIPRASDATPPDPSPKKRVKRRRIVGGNLEQQSHLNGMPYDLLYEVRIFEYLHPADLLSIAQTSKPLRSLVMDRSFAPVWRACMQRIPELPPKPEHLDEPDYVNKVYGDHCSVCLLVIRALSIPFLMDYEPVLLFAQLVNGSMVSDAALLQAMSP
ncbi:hypothetical protein EV715DRAFT_205992, partial [Schizophyllum commune]